MNDDLSVWKKILLSTIAQPQTDQEIDYVMRGYKKPSITDAILRDAYRGAVARDSQVGGDTSSWKDWIQQAIDTRTAPEMRNVTQRGQRFSPTGADMFDLWNPDLVPGKPTIEW